MRKLIADAVLLADPVQRDPRAGRIGDVVVPDVAGRPAWHRALLDPVGQPALLGRLQQRDEPLLEVDQVLVHGVLRVAADEAADRVDAEQHRGIERAQHELVLLLAHRRVVMQQVVEIADIREPDLVGLQHPLDPRGALLVERLPQIEGVGDRIEHRLGRHVGLGRVQRRRELDVIGAELAREFHPLLDRPIGIRVADLPRSQFLERRGQHPDLHELRIERLCRHQ